jgi:hypothetical protein
MQASGKGAADWFTGSVRVDPLFQVAKPALVSGASVTFAAPFYLLASNSKLPAG